MSYAIYPSLRGKNAIVTGGAEGIGAATVKLLSLQGCNVFILDIADESAKRTIGEISALSKASGGVGGAATITIPRFHHCDVCDLDELKAVAKRILDDVDIVHILVNNAAAVGKASRASTENVTPELWEFNINSNLRHMFFLTQALLPAMKKARSGSIVNLGSITWRIPAGDVPVYAACKSAIMGLTRTQSKEVGSYGIRINSVMPGAIATKRQREEVLTKEYREEVMRNQSLQRDLEPDEVAKVIVFLTSDEASAVTGSSYVVDGGWCSDP